MTSELPKVLDGTHPCVLCGATVYWKRCIQYEREGLHLVGPSGRIHECSTQKQAKHEAGGKKL